MEITTRRRQSVSGVHDLLINGTSEHQQRAIFGLIQAGCPGNFTASGRFFG